MSKVITFSRVFPSYHPKAGQPTYFVEQIQNSLISCNWEINLYEGINPPMQFLESLTKENVGYKHHTIRAGNHWKVGDKFSPRVWSGKPYNSKQIAFAPDIEIKKVWDIVVEKDNFQNENGSILIVTKIFIEGVHKTENYEKLAANDGLGIDDLCAWFTKPFSGQIICWNDKIEY